VPWDEKKQYPEFDSATIFSQRRNLDRKTTTQDLSAGALNYTSDISAKWRLIKILIHSDTNLSNTTITVKFNSLDGASYDTILAAQSFDGTADIALVAGISLAAAEGEDGDEIDIDSSGSDSSGILYVTLIYELLA